MSITQLTVHQIDQINQDGPVNQQVQLGTKYKEMQDDILGYVSTNEVQTLTNKTLTSPILQTAPKVTNDSVLSFGTTLTTPATKMTMVHDATTSGISQIAQGTSTVPQVLNTNPGSLVKAREVSIKHSAGAGDCDDLIADYKKIYVQGAGDTGLTPVIDRAILNVGLTGGANNSTISEGYVRQDTLTKGGTGTVERLGLYSGVLDVGTDNFTSNSEINGQTLVLQGSATITTGKVRGYSVDIKTGRVVEAAYMANCQATTGSGFEIAGSPLAELKLSSGAKIFTGSAATEAEVYAQVGTIDAIGSIYISTAGILFIQVANGAAATDWNVVTASHV